MSAMRNLPPLGELRAFEAAARHLSFLRAAEELAVTPSAISHRIRLLERHCGSSLFERRPRPLTLTPAGAELYPVVREGLDALAEALSSVRHASVRRDRERRPLKVTTTNAFASKWLVPRLPAWRAANPEVALDVIGTDTVLDIAAGEADVAIRHMRAAPAGLAAYELFRGEFVAVANPCVLPGGRPLASPDDLRGCTLVHSYWAPADDHAPTWKRWLKAASAVYGDVPGWDEMQHLSFREELHAIDAVCDGQGVLIVSDILVQRELQDGTLVEALAFSTPGYGFYLAYAENHPDAATIERFSSWMRERE